MDPRRRLAEPDELNLVPIMNLVTILIPFLLMAAQFVAYAAVEAVVPAIQSPAALPERPVDLAVRITRRGWWVTGRTRALPQGGLWVEDHDTVALRSALSDVKDAFPAERAVILEPEADVPYELLIATMDATREAPDQAGSGDCNGRCLFDAPVVAGGPEPGD